MSRTIVGYFDKASDAQQVRQELIAAGVGGDRITLTDESSKVATHSEEDPGFWETLKDAFGFAEEEDRYAYSEATRRGGVMVRVSTDEQRVDSVLAVMERHNVVDLDRRAAEWRQQGWKGYDAHREQRTATRSATAQRTAASGKEAIPVVEEELQVGKRQVQRGGVRVYSHVTERPVEEQVQLREEHVHVERRPVDRPVTDADKAFQERTIEATESAEQAVVSKQARVVEEVVVDKDVDQHTETVRDKVRRTDVEVEKLGPDDARQRGGAFADELLADRRYQGRQWDEVESDFRTHYEQRHPESKWDQVRDSVRERFNRSRSNAR